MSAPTHTVEILDHSPDILSFVPAVGQAADSNKIALGFFPLSVFEDFALKEQLFVAVKCQDGVKSYAGHLLFEARHPKARILQMFVAPAFRKQGIGTRLLDHLKKDLTDHAFISLYARVAEDLTEANHFWAAQGFYVQSTARGGERRKRIILVRSHELDTPQLFPASGMNIGDPLGLDIGRGVEVPHFLLDLNVLFDLGPRRRRNEDVLDLFRVERMGGCQLAISTEISDELARTASVGITDPMLAYARIFPSFPCPNPAEWEALSPGLASAVFPERNVAGALTPNDISDLRHLATAVHHRLAGLVTSDATILKAAALLKEHYGIQVISPSAFKALNVAGAKEKVFETSSSDSLSLESVSSADDPRVLRLLSGLGLSNATAIPSWAALDTNGQIVNRLGAWSNATLVGYLMWFKPLAGQELSARIAIDESQSSALDAVRVLLGHLIDEASAVGTPQIRLEFPANQACVREVASAFGFGGLAGHTSLTKLVLGTVVTETNWDACRNTLFLASQLRLPETPPPFRNVDQQIRVVRPDQNVTHVPLLVLESLLSPGLFCLKGRTAVMSPVRRDFSEHLLAHLPQKSLLPHARAQLYRERHYLAGAATLKHFKRGNLILFYESEKGKGLGAVVAVARVQHAYLKSQEAMEKSDLNPSVLDAAGLEAIGLSKIKTVAAFDNLIHFEQPVPRSTLQRLGCGSPHHLITTYPINDAQLQGILAEGFAHGKDRARSYFP